MIDFGGIGLSEQTPGMRAHLADWWRPDLAESFYPLPDSGNLAGLNHLPSTADHTLPPRLGVLRWPCGASRWSVFSAMVSRKQWDDINALDPGSHTLTLDDGSQTITADMWTLPARPVCRIVDGQDLFLLTLVDERFWWWYHGAVDVVAGATWAAFFASLFASLDGATATVETVPAAYLTPTTRFTVGAKPIPVVLDAAATSVGAKIIRSRAGVNTVTRPGTALTASAALWATLGRKIVTGGTVEALTRSLPAEVDVTFYGSTPAVTTVSLASLVIAELVGDGETGRIGVMWPDIPSTATAPQRAAAGTQAATDWYRWQAGAYEGTFKGLVDWTPTGLEDCIEWGFEDGKAFTTIHRWPVAVSNVYGDENTTGGGGTLTVQNTDGTAVDSPTSTLQFNKTTGLETAGTGGTSTVIAREAANNQTGTVNINRVTTQDLGTGNKRLNGSLQINNDFTFSATAGGATYAYYFVSSAFDPGTSQLTSATSEIQYTKFSGLTKLSEAYSTSTYIGVLGLWAAYGQTLYYRPSTATGWVDASFQPAGITTVGTDDCGTMHELIGPVTNRVAYSVFLFNSTTNLATRYIGADGTLAGATIKGGLVITCPPASPPAVSPSPPAGSARVLTIGDPGTVTLPDSDISASSYTASTRVLALKSDAQTKNLTLPNVSSTDSGLITAYPNNTTTFFRGDGTYAAIPSSPPGSFTTRSIVGTVTLTSSNELLKVSNSGIANTINLPAAATAGDGAWFEVVDFGGTAGSANITLDGNASETINGATTFVLNANYQGVKLVCNGSGWVAY